MTVHDYVLLVGLYMKPKNATKKKIFNNPKTSKIKKINKKKAETQHSRIYQHYVLVFFGTLPYVFETYLL